ncbi:hypothetical protein QL203_16895 [Cronobacter malonaticus]|uniref:hypothetical protein n=1 Tax=Cronobacter malonaticus TaxID=413503 RepID=UPI0012D2B8D6|nr:hypothetical protein [Cronobacter malonaticus]MDI6469445.1 hypothetical protein [Cronobacter malonaticus]HAU5445735.1 hypothetical protein [Cronobacter malonaticus]
MKLIDLLVRELPKRGGWPKLAKKIHQDHDGEVWGWINEDDPQRIFTLDQVATNARPRAKDETYENMVTRDQYEAAIAAAQQPAWDGEGLPPVGTICEYRTSSDGNLPVRIECVTQDGVAFTWLGGNDQYKGLDCVNAFWAAKHFKPVSLVADKKRAAGVTALAKAAGNDDFEYDRRTIDGELSSPEWYELYDKIAAGEVAGIRIE